MILNIKVAGHQVTFCSREEKDTYIGTGKESLSALIRILDIFQKKPSISAPAWRFCTGRDTSNG